MGKLKHIPEDKNNKLSLRYSIVTVVLRPFCKKDIKSPKYIPGKFQKPLLAIPKFSEYRISPYIISLSFNN